MPEARGALQHGTALRPLLVEAPSATASPFIDDYLAYLLARASHLISAEFHVVVRRERLPVVQWRVLAVLVDGQSLSIGDLAALVLKPQSTLTRVAERMVKAGLLLRRSDAADRRITRVRLSAAGLKLARRLVQRSCEHEAAVLSALSTADAAALKRILQCLVEQHAVVAPNSADQT